MIKTRTKYLTIILTCTFGLILTTFNPVSATETNKEAYSSVSDTEHTTAFNNVNGGKGTLDDYTELGITGVTAENLEDVNFYVKSKNNNSTKLQYNVTSVVNALNNINIGSTAVKNYTTLYILKVDSTNVSSIASCVKSAKEEKGSNLTRNEIISVVDTTLTKISSSQSKIDAGEATLDDYSLLGAAKITDENLKDVNWYVKGKDNSTPAKLQSNINSIINIISYINNGKGTITNYNKLTIESVNSDNISVVNSCIKKARTEKGKDLTRTEITSETNSIISSIDSAKTSINNGTGTLDEYSLLLLTNVTETNLQDVNWYIKCKDNVTIAKIKTNVNTIATALTNINNGNGKLTDYNTIGITSVTKDNLTPINSLVKKAQTEKRDNLTRTEIATVISGGVNDIPSSLAKINAGQATLSDYELLSISDVTELTLEDVNWYVKGKNSTTSTLKTNVNKILKVLNNVNKGTTVTSNYTTLGITTVTSANSSLIKPFILTARAEKDKNLTRNEIINVVNNACSLINLSQAKVNSGQATEYDYSILKITKVTQFNIEDVNWYVKGKNNSTTSKLQSNVNTILTAIANINKGKGTVANYNTLDITNITSSKLSLAKSAILNAETIKGSELTRTEIINAVGNL